MEEYIYELRMKVRDYECDSQGIVNNANYQHYTEHTRHEFLQSRGIRFSDLHSQGIDPVVARITLTYKSPLKGGDTFISRLNVKKEGVRYVFYQDIFREEDEKICAKAIVECVCVINGKLGTHEIFDSIVNQSV
mgnify:FL=1